MSMEYVRTRYNVPAKRGRRVQVYLGDGRLAFDGRIASASHYIHVRTDSDSRSIAFHPTWNVVYFDDDGSILADTRGDK